MDDRENVEKNVSRDEQWPPVQAISSDGPSTVDIDPVIQCLTMYPPRSPCYVTPGLIGVAHVE